MKNYIKLVSCVIISFAFLSCDKSDAYDGEVNIFDKPIFDESIPSQRKIKEMYEKYNVLFKSEYDINDIRYDWNNILDFNNYETIYYHISPANNNYIIPVIDSIDSWVFDLFPIDFAKKYLPLNIVLSDTLSRKQSLYNSVTKQYEPLHRFYEGFLTKNNTIISYVSPRFNEQKDARELRTAWLSLFVERMLINLPSISEFSTISQTAYSKSSFTSAEDVMVSYALLKKSRLKQNGSSATSGWYSVTAAQDFGDFVAFIVYVPEAEKQTIYAKNANILKKVNIVKAYFKNNFNIELPYRPIAN